MTSIAEHPEHTELLQFRLEQAELFQIESLQRVAVMAEFRNIDTAEHPIRVGDLAADIAIEIGADPDYVHRMRLAARLHDIGKIAVPDAILLKPGKLTPEEFEVVKTHTTLGAEILSGSSSPIIQLAEEVALTHHERWDGTGYPSGAGGNDIPLGGRIVTIADVFDALISARTYKHSWTVDEAVAYVVEGRGAQFEPRMVDAFVRVMAKRS